MKWKSHSVERKFHRRMAAPWQLHVCFELCSEVTMVIAEVKRGWEKEAKLVRGKPQMKGTPATVTVGVGLGLGV